MSRRQLYLHVGLSKSGTTYLQQALWDSRRLLREQGILYPGNDPDFQRRAAWDLLGRRLRGVDQPRLPGTWGRLVDEVTSWSGPRVVVSEEFLVHARPRHVRQIAQDFPAYELHVVVTVRDLERTIRSMWQQELVMGHSWSIGEYVSAVRDPEAGPTTAGARFWLRFDLERVLATWSTIAPTDRVHVVVVPRSGAPPQLLAARFGEVIGADPSRLQLPQEPVNPSRGVVETELLRRLNICLRGRLNDHDRHQVVEQLLHRSLPPSGQIRVPDEDLPWIRAAASMQADRLRTSSCHVVGDISDLVPPDRADADGPSEHVDEAALAECAITALGAMTLEYVRIRRRRARQRRSGAPAATKLASWMRAGVFSAGLAVLNAADRNRAASKATTLYLRHLAGRAARPAGPIHRGPNRRPAQFDQTFP